MSGRQNYLFADIPVEVSFLYNNLPKFCSGYETDIPGKYTIEISQKMIERERITPNDASKDEYLEALALHRQFCNLAINDDVLLFHSSALIVENKAYLFAAPSGVGKSTHASLWRDMLGEHVVMINDDKPFLREINGSFIVYGSPWTGKYHLGNNISAPLGGICFLNQGNDNVIRQLKQHEKLPFLLQQTYRPDSKDGIMNMLRLLVRISENIPMWHLDCNISREAAELSYNAMRNVSL